MSSYYTALIGRIFARLILIGIVDSDGKRKRGLVLCDCGTIKTVQLNHLIAGAVRSCGCLNAEAARSRAMRHGKSNSKIYLVWRAMLNRCNNPKCDKYEYYGGRGIRVCARWHHFPNFLEDMGEPQPGMTLDRKDNKLGYEKSNCRWASRGVQMNNRSNNIVITFRGKTDSLSNLCQHFELNYEAIYQRLKLGWDPERALSTPIRKHSWKNQKPLTQPTLI